MATITETLSLGLRHHQSGQFGLAEQAYRRVLEFDPSNSQAIYYLGVIASQVGNKSAAADLIRQAIAIDPTKSIYFYNLGEALQATGNLDEAIAAYRHALQLNPSDPECWNNLGRAFQSQGNAAGAIDCYQRALALRPEDADAMNNLGGVLQTLGNLEGAIACYRSAIQLRPAYVQVYCNLGSALKANAQPEQARDCYQHALQLQPNSIEAMNGLIVQQQEMCCWTMIENLSLRLIQEVEHRNKLGIRHQLTPMSFLGLPTCTTPSQQLEFCQTFFANQFGAMSKSFQAHAGPHTRSERARIRIAYLSSDLQTHPVGLSICELFENHDRTRFEVAAYSYGKDDQSETRNRISKSCDRFIDIGKQSFVETAKRIYNDRVDILIDLMGHTFNARSEIMALRPAPVQIQFLGFAGTMGTPCIDYIVADDFVIPQSHSSYYCESILRLPHCFLPSDTKRNIATSTTRHEHGLPNDALVLCSFNNSSKITPAMFAAWMRLLDQIPDSVLWVYVHNEFAAQNLRQEAVANGIDPERLVFARRLPSLNDHLARYRLADLFLDTFPYNAHSTAADSLWMGCPVVTLSGQTFASRVAGSLLRAACLE